MTIEWQLRSESTENGKPFYLSRFAEVQGGMLRVEHWYADGGWFWSVRQWPSRQDIADGQSSSQEDAERAAEAAWSAGR